MIRPSYWTTPSDPIGCAVYRLLDADGTLLYVGMGGQPRWRFLVHRRSPWGHLIDRVLVCWYGSTAEAHEAEVHAIRTEGPIYNQLRYPEASRCRR